MRSFARDHGFVREYEPGDRLLEPGDPGDRIRFLLTGAAGVVFKDEAGREISVYRLRPGEIFGEISFLTEQPLPADSYLIAEDHCRVLEIPAEDFETLLRQDPDFSLQVAKNLAHKVMELDRTVFRSKLKKRALQSLISREDHIFPDYLIGDYVRRNLSERIEEFALTDGPVLIIGETGVGKEVLAHAIFRISHEYKEVFLLLDLLRTRAGARDSSSGSPWSLEKGGVERDHPEIADLTDDQLRLFFGSVRQEADSGPTEIAGYMELTEDGTLLVRGVEHLTAAVQEDLLKAVTVGTYRKVDGKEEKTSRVRLIATTELDPSEISPDRHPLIHGLMHRSMIVPPLRKRRREIPVLVKHYLKKYSQDSRKDVPELPKHTLSVLVNYSWPGNDVELSTTLKRAVLVAEGGTLRPQDIYFDLKRVEGRGKVDLLRFRPVRGTMMSPLFPAILQSAATPFFFILLVFFFLGPADPIRNPAALFSWAVGWPTLIIGGFMWARFWCTLCPIGTVSNLVKKVVSWDLPFPAFLKTHSDFLVAAAVLFIIWVETATDMRNSPLNLGILLGAMLVSAVVVAAVFERHSWCRYLCGLGGMTAVLAKTSLIELRADRNVCISQCTSNECFTGTANVPGCPFGQAGPRLHSNRLCKLCGNCVKNCPHGAIKLNLRIPGQELWEIRHTNAGTAFMVIGMIGGLLSELAYKMGHYGDLTAKLPLSEVGRFTAFFVVIVLAVNICHVVATVFSKTVFGDSFDENYSRYGLALLPLALTAFMAFHLYYLINLGVQIPIQMSQMFDFDILKQLIIKVPPEWTHLVQTVLIWTGLFWTFFVVYRLGRASHDSFSQALPGMLPHFFTAFMLAFALDRAMTAYFFGG
ncbi:MAG: cyclic nucleotide-binding domain-containing protein [Pseudomonadota bacterium]